MASCQVGARSHAWCWLCKAPAGTQRLAVKSGLMLGRVAASMHPIPLHAEAKAWMVKVSDTQRIAEPT